MPYSVNLNRCSVSINQQTQLILELFKKACDLHFKNRNREERVITDFAISEKQLKKGLISKLVRVLESVNEKTYGGGFVTLNQIDNLELDPKADKMLQAYTTEIDTIFYKNGKTTYDLNQEENLSSAALVFRMLLLRLVTIALCNNNTNFRDGEVLLQIYSYFVDQVLCHVSEFDDQKIFDYFASKEHVEWMNSIGGAVLAVKTIHSHSDNISKCLTNLKSLTSNIEAMIVAYLAIADSQSNWPILKRFAFSPSVHSWDLSDRLIERKFLEYEKYIIGKTEFKDDDDIKSVVKATGITTYAAIEHLDHRNGVKSIIGAHDIRENSHVAVLIALKNNKCPESLLTKLELLYNLYFYSRCLIISLEQIDDLITSCSWVPIVMGMINLSKICEAMRKHVNTCSEVLSIPNNDLITQLHFKQAILQKSFHMQNELREMHAKILALEDLQNPVRIKKIKYHIQTNLNHLLEIESALEVAILKYNVLQSKPTVPLIQEVPDTPTHSPKLFSRRALEDKKTEEIPRLAYWA